MSKEIIMLGDIEIEKHKFQRYENVIIFSEDLDTDNVLVYHKISSGGCLYDDYKIN